MAEARTDCICIAVIEWIWTLVKRPFISMVKNSQDNQVIAVMDASASLSSAASSSSSEMRTSCVAAGPGTSSSAAVEWKYDVYLSFGGKVLPDAMGSKEDFEGYEEPIQAMDEEMKELTIESSASQWKHDVFLSFRGPDTRKGIASSLFHELQRRGIRTFMDEKGLKAGNHISSNLLTAIKESRSAIVILSPKYASSAWCLDELAYIVQGWETRNTLIFPVFYNVEPHDVRHQIGSFEELFTGRGKQRHGKKVLNQWKAALTTVANLTGFESKIYRSDRHLVEEIVQYVFSQVRNLEIESPGSKFKATKKALGKVVEALIEDEIAASSVLGGIISKETLAFISQAITLLPYWNETIY